MSATPNQKPTHSIHFLSLNAKGMNTWIKRQNLWSYLQQVKSGITFLQDTHLKNNHVSYLRRGWVGQVFHSQFSTKARGTAILIHTTHTYIHTRYPLSSFKQESDCRYKREIYHGFRSTVCQLSTIPEITITI